MKGFCLKERKMRRNSPKKNRKSLLWISKRRQKKLLEEIAGLMLATTVKKVLEVEDLGGVI